MLPDDDIKVIDELHRRQKLAQRRMAGDNDDKARGEKWKPLHMTLAEQRCNLRRLNLESAF